jgi:hypothetical protein
MSRCIYLGRHQVKLELRRSKSKPSPARCGSEVESAHGARPTQFGSLSETLGNYSVTRSLGNERAVSRICCPLVSCLHSFIHLSPCSYSPFFTRLAFSYSTIISNPSILRVSRSLLLANRLHHPFRGLRRHTTPRLASLRCDTLSSWSRPYPPLGPRLLQAGLLQAHTHTYCIHTFTHTFIHTLLLRPPPPQLWRGTQTHRHPAARRIRLRAQHPTKSLGIGLHRTKKRTVSNTAQPDTS